MHHQKDNSGLFPVDREGEPRAAGTAQAKLALHFQQAQTFHLQVEAR